MQPLYNVNGLIHWSEREIKTRERAIVFFADEISNFLLNENPAWKIERTEAPIMIPRRLINVNYTNDDLWVFQKHDEHEEGLVARPETTPSTYTWMQYRLNGHNKINVPYCVWQAGKSFRAEQDNVLGHMRLKEFYQQEFQCAYTVTTSNDYYSNSLEAVRSMISTFLGQSCRIIESDRLPSYSLKTMDIEVLIGDRWMEIASISKRIDFPQKAIFGTKSVDIIVLEIAIGLDRVVHAWTTLQKQL